MEKSHERVDQIVDRLKQSFEQTPYFLQCQDYQEGETKDDVILSVIIPARNEFPNIVHTIYSIWHCWEADGFDPNQIEIIIVNNCSTDWQDPKYDFRKPGDRGTTEHLFPRGAFWARKVRVHYDPVAGNHSARNKGAQLARGKYLFFSDAHMAYRPSFFKHMIETIEQTGGMFHGAIAWMGAYPPSPHGVGCGYTIKLGEEIKGTWHTRRPSNDKFFYIPALGHCSVGVLRKQFLEFGGYPEVHRSYGGGEFFINMLWWMMGSSVSVHPQAIGYHLSSGRGYSWNHDDYISNVLGIAWALGMDEWRGRAYLNWLRRGRKEVMERLDKQTRKEYQSRRLRIEQERKYTFNEIILQRPWSKLNEKTFGQPTDDLLIYEDTWLDLLKNSPKYVQDEYNNPEWKQKELAQFIEENLRQFVYKPNH